MNLISGRGQPILSPFIKADKGHWVTASTVLRDLVFLLFNVERVPQHDLSCASTYILQRSAKLSRAMLSHRQRVGECKHDRCVIIAPLRQMRCAITVPSMTAVHDNGSNITAIITLLPEASGALNGSHADDLPDVART